MFFNSASFCCTSPNLQDSHPYRIETRSPNLEFTPPLPSSPSSLPSPVLLLCINTALFPVAISAQTPIGSRPVPHWIAAFKCSLNNCTWKMGPMMAPTS